MPYTHVHIAKRTRLGLITSFRLELVRGEGVVPPEGWWLKVGFTTVMLFPDQTCAWMQTGMGSQPEGLLLSFKNPIHFSLAALMSVSPITQMAPSSHTSHIITPKMQQQFKANECCPKSTNTSHAREVCMQSVKAFPALFSFSRLACSLKPGTWCRLQLTFKGKRPKAISALICGQG